MDDDTAGSDSSRHGEQSPPELDVVTVTNPTGPDETAFFPKEAEAELGDTRWIRAYGDAFVALEEMQ